MEKYGGNPKVVIAEPEITHVKINSNFDFIVLACNFLFDKFR